ncbi:hypothetical protein SSS_10083 [Sarcoptes scabiei]|nr:hypothetical protein SSS_10083 [Sarcoptes scabiei]
MSNYFISIFLFSVCMACWIVRSSSSSSSASDTSIPSEKSSQTDQDIIENMAKLTYSPFTSSIRSDMDRSNDIDTIENRYLLNKLFSMLERKKLPQNFLSNQAYLTGQQKRQIRYQQCYFNPISCF